MVSIPEIIVDLQEGAFCECFDLAPTAERSEPLTGRTFAVKDVIDVEGHKTSGGNPLWGQAQEASGASAPCVTQLLDAGAHCIGKTKTEEFAYSLIGNNIHFGAPFNPVTPERYTGGSSSGSASAVAQGQVDFALGTDTAGSVRVPAAFCGLYGMRPTLNRVDSTGVMPLAPSFDVVGWFARDPDVLNEIGVVLLKGQGSAPSCTPQVLLDWPSVQKLPEMERKIFIEEAFRVADKNGVACERLEVIPVPWHEFPEMFTAVQVYEAWRLYGDWVERHKEHLAPEIYQRFLRGKHISSDAYRRAQDLLTKARDGVQRFFGQGLVLIRPTTICAAPLKSASDDDLAVLRDSVFQMTCLAGVGGLPELTIPIAAKDAPALGLSLVGGAGMDEILMTFAQNQRSG